ncbi:ECF transporter S component [Sinanaerobacter chloroacetimidivorans]|jgi:uncharacterized membrane protein|uniref:ECF transporter S component n=1 Tax=Sinanaerobacter chloroacetimidivorans TaxID=2818044 RepID=A0A8J7W0P8_9FIRM|nr:ECF transporter S component [Sinanaerobacter chloroacetimidivorans]MBR0598236.1 ECF transporter S component [Sinanaerobacter chloroacetimidivorans]
MSISETKVRETKVPDLKKKKWTVKRISIMAIFIALSAVGAMIKIPSPIGSIGLDSCPGYFCALAFGSAEGAIIIAIGHLLSAAVVGFPLTIPIHLAVAVCMGILAVIFRLIGRKGTAGLVVSVVAIALLNSFGVGLLLLPLGGWGLYLANIVSLLVAAAVNTIIAAIAYASVKNSKLLS